jgi:hypothetical protein
VGVLGYRRGYYIYTPIYSRGLKSEQPIKIVYVHSTTNSNKKMFTNRFAPCTLGVMELLETHWRLVATAAVLIIAGVASLFIDRKGDK